MTRPAIAIALGSPPPNAKVVTVAAEVAHPGHMVARIAPIASSAPHGFQSRWNPPIAVSPVASVYRSISMLMKNWTRIPTTAAHRKTRPACDAMNG